MALSHSEFQRAFSRGNVQDALRRRVRNNKKKSLPPKETPSVPETNSIFDLMTIGRKAIDERVQEEFRTTGTVTKTHRVDFYYIDQTYQWYMADSWSPSGKRVVEHLSRYISLPKPALEGGTISNHFWLQFAFPYDMVFEATPEGWNKLRVCPGVGVFDDTYRIGIGQEDTDFETDFEDYLDDQSIVPDGDCSFSDEEYADDSESDATGVSVRQGSEVEI